MHSIQIGDPTVGFLTIQGPAVSPPFYKAIPHFQPSADPFVHEVMDLQLKGTASQILQILHYLEVFTQRALLYEQVQYASPQYLRFQLVAGGDYYYTPISNLYYSGNPAGFINQQISGSKVVYLHYTRPNYFDGPAVECPLTGRAGTDVTGGYNLLNHTDSGTNHGSTALVKKTQFFTHLPAPVRFEYKFNSSGAAEVKDLFVGIFHHLSYSSDSPFFAYYNTLTGGTNYANAGAIQGNYKRLTWAAAIWTSLTSYLIDTAYIKYFNGRPFRPIIHFFNTHAYSDLYFRVQIERYGDVLYVSEPVYSPPGYGYLILPTVELPPNYLLREQDPARIQVCIYALREAGTTTTIDIDCLTLFPLSYAASFYGFNNLQYTETLVDDSHRNRFNVWTGTGTGEIIGQTRVGSPLEFFPNNHCRLFFYVTNPTDLMPIDHAGILKVYYRPRYRVL